MILKANKPITTAFIQRATDKLLVMCLVLMTLIPNSPLFASIPTRDPGVFLYVGWRILNGELPYRDVWDHKPPIIYYINALGLALTNNSRWGVWILEVAFLFLAATLGFHMIKKIFGFYPSIISLLLWLLTLPLLFADGNFTNEYTLPLQFLALWLFYDVSKSPQRSPYRWFFIGFTGAVAFFTKQTAIGIWVGITLLWTVKRLTKKQVKSWLSEMLFFSAGTAFIGIAVVAFFAAQGALGDFWNAAFKYNFTYLSATNNGAERVLPLLMGIDPLTESGLFQFSMLGYGIGCILLLWKKEIVVGWNNLLLLGVIDLPLEFFLSNISGRVYAHYFISTLPVLSLFAGLTFWVIISQLSSWHIPETVKTVFQVGIIVIFLWSSLFNYAFEVRAIKQVPWASVVDYIETHTTQEDTVLLWGAETAINYQTQRKGSTPYVYQYPLYMSGYVNEEMILKFLDDTIKKRPQLIIDTKNPETPMYRFPIQTKAIAERIAYIESNYKILETVDGWTVYGSIQER